MTSKSSTDPDGLRGQKGFSSSPSSDPILNVLSAVNSVHSASKETTCPGVVSFGGLNA